MYLAKTLLRGLKAYGAAEIFGIPGDFALPLFKVIEESRILPLYTLSHEPAVGFAADAAARFHSKPSVAAVTYGAGAINMLNPVAAAYAEKSPVVVLSGGPGAADRATGLGVHHQAKRLSSQLEMYREVTCDQAILDDTEEAPAIIARVLRNCITQTRPVYIEVPRDKVFEPCASVPRLPTKMTADADALDACAEEILERLKQAKSPVLIVDVEIRRFGLEPQVTELCGKLNIPVATSFMGRGLLAGKDVPLRGTYMGIAGDPELTALVEGSDALFLLGVILSDTNFGVSEKKIDLRRTILACDGQVSLGYHTYLNMPLPALVEALNRRLPPVKTAAAAVQSTYPHGLEADDSRITPTDIARAVNDMFTRTDPMPIAADMGDCLFTALDIEYTDLVAPGYYATMGFGVPAGLGVQAATGRRPLILVGDGAFQMTGWELLNCRRYGWNPIVLVFNNRSWEMLRAFQPESKFNDLDDIPYAELAKNLGGAGRRVTTRRELQAALEQAAKDASCFQLIEIMLERGLLSSTLSRFVEGFKQLRK
ncbi:MAG: indolepyruvate/phenylpyruvate decarboxylase [Gammaproteobacteria bacterium]|nr:indolepyruvate/phenylpyruvate decarboxylase [Gammaproteobacteria bacterium]